MQPFRTIKTITFNHYLTRDFIGVIIERESAMHVVLHTTSQQRHARWFTAAFTSPNVTTYLGVNGKLIWRGDGPLIVRMSFFNVHKGSGHSRELDQLVARIRSLISMRRRAKRITLALTCAERVVPVQVPVQSLEAEVMSKSLRQRPSCLGQQYY